jgi:hypothetical protein
MSPLTFGAGVSSVDTALVVRSEGRAPWALAPYGQVDMIGRVIATRYRLTAQLGAGGMGSVWRAEHLTLGSPVAVKLIDDLIARDPGVRARFEREAQAAAALRAVGSNSSQTHLRFSRAYHFTRQRSSTSVQYSPSTSAIPSGHAAGATEAFEAAGMLALGVVAGTEGAGPRASSARARSGARPTASAATATRAMTGARRMSARHARRKPGARTTRGPRKACRAHLFLARRAASWEVLGGS